MSPEKDKNNCSVALDSLTIHGLPRVFTSPTLKSKFIWVILFGSSLVGFGIFAIPATQRYLSRKAQKSREIENETLMLLPSVTICNMRKLYYLQGLNQHNIIISKSSPEQIYQANFHWSNKTTRKLDLEDFSAGYSNIVETITDFCELRSFTGKCDKSWFESLSLMPGCITFNPNGTANQLAAGQPFGFRMLLYINSSLYKRKEDRMHLGLTLDDFKVMIHQPGSYPNLFDDSAYVEMGQHSQVQLVMKKRSLLSPPYGSQCRSGQNGFYPGKYQQSLCFASCFIKNAYSRCGEIPSMFRKYFPYKILPRLNLSNVDDAQKCANGKMKEHYHKHCNCPPECELTSYKISSSSSTWPPYRKLPMISNYLSKSLNISITEKQFKTDFALLSVFFDQFQYTHEREVLSYDIDTFLGDLGGQAGLYMGASFFSILELGIVGFFFVLSYVKHSICKIANRKSYK